MNIGIDLDHTLCGFPEFFREFIPAMIQRGHKILCTSNRFAHSWKDYVPRLEKLGIDPSVIDHSMMQVGPVDGGAKNKARMADQCDIVFDDDADVFQHLTKTPIFKVPREKAKET